MTVRRLTITAAAALATLLATSGVPTGGSGTAFADPVPGGEAARTRSQSMDITASGSTSAGGQETARPRSEPRSSTSSGTRSSGSRSSSTRSGSRAVPRGNEPASQIGTRKPEADRGSRGGDFFRGGHRTHATIYWGPYWYPWGGWWGWGWPYYPWGGYGAVRYYPSQVRPSMGALDLDLRPEEAQVYLNGQLIGIADHFDGWPRYLWLDEGTYDLVFYLDGHQTLARQYSIYPGVVIDVEDRLVPGESTPPEDLFARSTARRDERMRRDEERREAADAREPAWKERVREERERAERDAGDAPPYDARQAPVRMLLNATPGDAAVYLDGRFIGAADELFEGGAAVVVDPGEHELEVVRPGYASKRMTFSAESGEAVELEVELEELE